MSHRVACLLDRRIGEAGIGDDHPSGARATSPAPRCATHVGTSRCRQPLHLEQIDRPVDLDDAVDLLDDSFALISLEFECAAHRDKCGEKIVQRLFGKFTTTLRILLASVSSAR